ncbi:MAG TPA: hypothetical protein DHV48_03545 [Prolixibacteraceae bacterium]|nr:hypothetical protein [Prolixibacteraceae bacterium]
MIIFTVIGILVSVIVGTALVLIAHYLIYDNSKAYRIFIDWLQLPKLVFYTVKKLNKEELENSICEIEKTHFANTLRWKIAKRAINKRISILKKSE